MLMPMLVNMLQYNLMLLNTTANVVAVMAVRYYIGG